MTPPAQARPRNGGSTAPQPSENHHPDFTMPQNLSLTALEQRDEFIARHIGSPSEELDAMLDAIGAPNLDTLIDQTVPPAIRLPAPMPLADARPEAEALAVLKTIASKNKINKSLIKVDSVYNDVLPVEGGIFEAYIITKGNGVSVEIPEDAKEWLSIVSIDQKGTDACVKFQAARNEGGDRSTSITFRTTDGKKDYTSKTELSQQGAIVEATVAEFIAAEVGATQYRISGVVTKIANTQYGNIYIKDFSGDVYIYGIKDFADSNIKEGDIVTLVGPRAEYKGTPQMTNAVAEDVKSVKTVTVADFLAAEESPSQYYQLTGTVSNIASTLYGNFDITETKDLANVLRAGKLPAAADIVQSEVVGPSLGQEAIDNGTTSALVGLLLVSLWMLVYYGRAGWYANIALAVNLLFLFGILASLGAVLTLPGIAGIVLTMGTAVDANIIIYERAKEELRSGKTLNEAVIASYSWKGAMRSIVDANVTHILTGAVLFIFGSGPIKGFATTLLIGIVTSLFTSIFIARIFIDRNIAGKNNLTFVTNFSKNFFTNFHYNFLGIKKWSYAFSAIVTVVSIISIATNGFDQGVDFVGGRTFQVRFDKSMKPEEIKEELTAIFGSAEVKIFGQDNQLKITTKYKIQETGIAADEEVNKLLYASLKKHYSPDVTYDKFVNAYEGKKLGIVLASKVGPTVAEDIKTNAYWAVLGAMLIVGLYLVISFRKWQYSLGAIAAVAHDVIFVLGIYSLCYKFMPFGMEIDQHFIAAILTVIGYSMNDTVIVFDRVREFLDGKTKGNFSEIVNNSINSTMSRTINTSLTMIVVLLIMFVFGGESIRGFIFAMLIGIIVGTYSSLFIATPVLVDSISIADKKLIEERHNENK